MTYTGWSKTLLRDVLQTASENTPGSYLQVKITIHSLIFKKFVTI